MLNSLDEGVRLRETLGNPLVFRLDKGGTEVRRCDMGGGMQDGIQEAESAVWCYCRMRRGEAVTG